MPRYRALIEYDGSGYRGFQRQRAEHQTIQGELERALGNIVHQSIPIVGAGRTDSGVHATGQVVSFTIRWGHGSDALQRALNVNLPLDITVLQLHESEPDFHPRFDARRRTYEYHIYNTAVRSSLRRLRSWHIAKPLDIVQMNKAAQCLLGVHDFASFGQPPQGSAVTIRELFVAEWKRNNQLLMFTVQANAFLYRMVRSLVGSLVKVGRGDWTLEQFVDVLHSCDRGRSAAIAPAHGLYLVDVTYEED